MPEGVVPGTAKDLKIGKYVMIDDEPCKVVEMQVSAPGKHGAAKMRITGIGIFDGSKYTLMKPSDGDIEVPTVERKIAQVVSIGNDVAQLMDPTTYEMYELKIPEELKGQVEAGKEVELLEAIGKRLMQKVR
ncbi:Translation initiation factor 5A [uncultured archaeon]|nr:Translation initiation factor 5A [uncultured archaeon]